MLCVCRIEKGLKSIRKILKSRFRKCVFLYNTSRVHKTWKHLNIVWLFRAPQRERHWHNIVDGGKVTDLNRGAPDGYGQLSDSSARGRSGYPGCVPLQRAPGQGLPAACSQSPSAPSLGPLLDTVQEANQEDVSRQVVHPAVHQDAALRAAELIPGADNVFQAAAAERVLARQHLGRGVQALQAHRALQQIQQRRRLVHVGGEGEHLGFSVRGDAAATGSCTVEMNRGHRTFWEAANGRPTTESPRAEQFPPCCERSPLFRSSLCLPQRVSVSRFPSPCPPPLSGSCAESSEVTLSSSSSSARRSELRRALTHETD